MRIFVLEDNEERSKWFVSEFGNDHDLVMTTTVVIGSELVKVIKFDIMFLDHDLGGRTFVSNNDPNCGQRVVEAILESKKQNNTCIIIHSWNEPAARYMETTLKNGEHKGKVLCVPFGMFDKTVFF